MTARIRLGSSGPFAVAADYGNGVAVLGAQLTAVTPDAPPEWRIPAPPPTDVRNMVYVDQHTASVTHDGSAAHPYLTVQEAITRARELMTLAVSGALAQSCIIMIASGIYVEDVAVPPPIPDEFGSAIEGCYVLQAWSHAHPATGALPLLQGIWTVEDVNPSGSYAFVSTVAFDHLRLFGSISSLVAGHTLKCAVTSCVDARSVIQAGNVELWYQASKVAVGDIYGTVSAHIESDDYSWGTGLWATAVHSPSVLQQHQGAGFEVSKKRLSASGVTVGTSQAVTMTFAGALPGDFAEWSGDSAVVDFTLQFVGCAADQAVFVLTNLSRASGDFSDDGYVRLSHRDLPGSYL